MMTMRYYVSIEESLQRILGTPQGQRVMRPEYGSRLFELIDRRFNEEWRLDAIQMAYEAIDRWEKRIEIIKIVPVLKDLGSQLLIVYRLKGSEEEKVFQYDFL